MITEYVCGFLFAHERTFVALIEKQRPDWQKGKFNGVGQRPGDCLRMREQDIRDGVIYVTQGKTGAKLRVRVIGKLAEVIARIMVRKATLKVRSFSLVINEAGQPLTASALDGRFGKARAAAGVSTMDFQFRDLRAKAGTEVEDAHGIEKAQHLLGHADAKMTKGYVRHRLGKLTDPTK